MESLLERAKNHKTSTEGREILGEAMMALKEGKITTKDTNKISKIIGKKIKKANKELKENGSSEYID